MEDLIYCENCLENLENEKFDYRFDYPICHECVTELELEPMEEE